MECCERRRPCRPRCMRRCVGEVVKKYRIYKTCCFDVVAVCCCCGHEYDHDRHETCPHCGAPGGDPPVFGRFGGFGMFGRFGGFGRFGRFGRFGFPFRRRFFFPGLFPFREEEEEEEFEDIF